MGSTVERLALEAVGPGEAPATRQAAPGGLWLIVVACVTAFATASPAAAQDLSDEATLRAVRAAVRIQVEYPNGTSTGSGTIIDPRGYVLTNFHVVGFTRHGDRGGAPGVVFGDGQHVQIATVESDRDTARTRWIGRVVRADVRLDVALIRIMTTAEGAPVPAGTTFPTVPMAPTSELRPGASVWCFGFPLGIRTINVTGGRLTGFQMNTRGEVAWIRTDAEFNPGNSGGMVVDRQGRLVAIPTAVLSGDDTLEPIEVARPVERLPSSWSQDLARGHIEDVQISGVLSLTQGAELRDESVGDGGALDAPEIHYFIMPSERPGQASVTPSFPLGVIAPTGRMVREGEGSVPVFPNDPPGSMLAVLVPRAEDGSAVQLRVRFDVQAVPSPTPYASAPNTGQAAVPYGYAPYGQQPYGGGGNYAPPSGPHQPYAAQPPPQQYAPPGQGYSPVLVRGRMVDAATGQPVQGMVLIGQPGLNLEQHINMFLQGRMTGPQFESALVASARTDANGFYELRGVPRGSYPGAGMSAGYRPAILNLTIRPTDASIIDVNPIRMAR